MHSSTELSAGSFAIWIGGEPATFAALLPEFDERDRLGVVVRRPYGAVGASTLLLAAVTAFYDIYDIQRASGEDFFIYPDFFIFHVGRPLGDHSMLEIWPSHKEVVVADDSEAILRAVNDRAITRLLVQEGQSGEVRFDRETLASARRRIVGAIVYSAQGRVGDADVRVAGNDVTESYVNAVLDPAGLLQTLGNPAQPYSASVARRADEVPDAVRVSIRADRAGLLTDGRPVETFRRLAPDQALALL
jgi:hypothetical protein